MLVELWRSRRGRSRTWSVEADGTRDRSMDRGLTANKDRTLDWRETSIARRRKKNKVSNPRNPTPCLSLAVNLVCVLVDYRVVNTGSKTKYRLSIDSEREMLRERCAILSISTTTCNMRNPKTCNVGLLILTIKNINVIGREPKGVRSGCAWREVRSRCVWTEPEYKQRIKPQVVIVRNRDSKSAVRWSSEEKTRKKTEKRKVESWGGEPVPAEQLPRKEGSVIKREETEKPNKAREVTKSRKRIKKGEFRSQSESKIKGTEEFNKARKVMENRRRTGERQLKSLSEDRVKRTESASTYSNKEAKRPSKTRGKAEQPSGKLSGIHKPNLSRYKSILLSSKGAYYESPYCNRKQTKWEYTQMSMSVWNMIKTCMLDRILKLCAWNKYPRNYEVTNEYIVCMMYDKINIHTLTIPTIKWKHHISELRFCKMLKHTCEFTRNKKIWNSIALVKGSVTHGLCVIRKYMLYAMLGLLLN